MKIRYNARKVIAVGGSLGITFTKEDVEDNDLKTGDVVRIIEIEKVE